MCSSFSLTTAICVGFHNFCAGTKKIAIAHAAAANKLTMVRAGDDSRFQAYPVPRTNQSGKAVKQGLRGQHRLPPRSGNPKLNPKRAITAQGNSSLAIL